jgi:hypothetical protein
LFKIHGKNINFFADINNNYRKKNICIKTTPNTKKIYIFAAKTNKNQNVIMLKKTFKIIAVAMLAAATIGCGGRSEEQMKADAASLIAVNHNVDSVYNALKQSYETFQAAEMDRALEGFNKYLAEATKTLGGMNVGPECQPLHQLLNQKVETMRSIASNEAKEQVRIYKIPDSDFTDELRQQWDNISSAVDKKVSVANTKVNQAIETINQKSKKSGK